MIKIIGQGFIPVVVPVRIVYIQASDGLFYPFIECLGAFLPVLLGVIE
jgi:hypothetical protein